MYKRLRIAIVTLLLVSFVLVGRSVGYAVPAAQAPTPTIKLRAGTITPGIEETLPGMEGLTIEGYAPGQPGYYIVQFKGAVQDGWTAQLAASGAQVLEYLPDFAFKVRMTPELAAQLQAQANVNWVGLFQPAFKLSPELATDGQQLYRVRVENGADATAAAQAIAATGAQVLAQEGSALTIAAAATQLGGVAHVLDVAWIDNFVLYEKHNDTGAGVIVGTNAANALGYDGSTQIAAVADTGLGGGTAATAHVDVPAARVAGIFNWPGAAGGCFQTITDDGAIDVDSGHGTHVALSVVGGANGIGRGGAPAARLVFQSTENYVTVSNICRILYGYTNGYYLTGLPSDLNQLYAQAYTAGARIHSNSWGSSQAGVYTANSAQSDQFVWNNEDMVITFSAGNAGADANANGVVDNDSIGSPATAKNVITVGASENARADNFPCDTGLTYTSSDAYQSGQTCASMGGLNQLGTAGQRWGFTTEPLNSDPSGGNAQQMAPFSSRGPTDDGRIKPDIVAPGAWILSGYSDLYQQGYDAGTNPRTGTFQSDGWGMPLTNGYKYFGGTSMSNPIAAGGATLVRDFYQKAYGLNASAALVKATLINTAVDLLDENNDGANDNDYPIPNVHEGWGRINLAEATDGTQQYVDNTAGLSTGGSASYQYNVSAAGAFKVTLVWSDYPSTETAAVNLVNDLDLTVTSPTGAVYRGNVFGGGWSQTGGSADRTNNVENVYVQAGGAGAWTVQVSGFNVPNGPQPFALVVNGGFGAAPTPTNTSTPTNTPIPGPTNTPTATSTNTAVPPTATPTNTPVPPTATPTATPTNTPAPGGTNAIYVSSTTDGNVGFAFSDEDIVRFDPNTNTWTLYFDGSDAGLGANSSQDIDAFDLLDDGSILLSIAGDTTIPNVGAIDDADIVRFVPTALGQNTAGTYSWYFDGSDVGLTTADEDVDAVDLLSDGRIVISTLGNVSVTGASGADEDLLVFTPTRLGTTTSGAWSLYFDGSDVALTATNEDVNGVWINPATGQVYLSTLGAFAVTGASGDGADIFVCTPGTLGATTSCTFSLYWDGSANGFAGEIADGIGLTAATYGAAVVEVNATLPQDDPTAGNTFDDYDDMLDQDVEAATPQLYLPLVTNR
jgi:serine protease AprX